MINRVTIEEISGELMTVVWCDDANFIALDKAKVRCGYELFTTLGKHVATALPALPRHPKPEDAPLLYRYMAEELLPYLDDGNRSGLFNGRHVNGSWLVSTNWGDDMLDGMGICDLYKTRINHAIYAGERVEIAIKG